MSPLTNGATDPPSLTPVPKQLQFYAVIITSVISVLVGLGVIGPDFAAHHEQLVNAIALLASVLGPALYAIARAISQHGHQLAVAHVSAARTAAQGQLDLAAMAPAPPARAPSRRADGGG